MKNFKEDKMQIGEKTYCNVCMVGSEKGAKIVFVKAICDDEDVHICTSCIPQVIHGSGEILKSNEEVKEAAKG